MNSEPEISTPGQHADLERDGECPECGYPYDRLATLTPGEVRNLLLADMYDCSTCNTLLPAWARTRIDGDQP